MIKAHKIRLHPKIKEGVNRTMYTILIQVEADGPLFPRELKNTEVVELIVESAVGCSLGNLYASVALEVAISRSSREVERDWDALLSPDL